MKKTITANSYEIVFISKSDTEAVLNRVAKLIEELSGSVTKKEAWGKKGFTYRIKKEATGYYFDWQFSLMKDQIKVFEKNLRFEEDVLRYLLLTE